MLGALATFLGVLLSRSRDIADLASSVFGSFVAVSGDAHQAKVAQDIFRQQVRYERSLQIREDMRDVNKLMMESVQTHVIMGSIVLGVCWNMCIEGYPPFEADRTVAGLWAVFSFWSVTFTLIALWFALRFQMKMSSSARERLLRRHRLLVPDDLVVGRMGGHNVVNQVANFHNWLLGSINKMAADAVPEQEEEVIPSKPMALRRHQLRVESCTGAILDAEPLRKGMHGWLHPEKEGLSHHTILDVPFFLAGETLVRSPWEFSGERPLAIRVFGEATLYVAAQCPPLGAQGKAGDDMSTTQHGLRKALWLDGQMPEWPADELPFAITGFHEDWQGDSGYGEFRRVEGFSMFVDKNDIELPLYKLVLATPRNGEHTDVVLQWNFKMGCEALLIMARKGQVHCKEEDWPLAEFNAEVKEVMSLRRYSGLYLRYGTSCLLLSTCFLYIARYGVLIHNDWWFEASIIMIALLPSLITIRMLPIDMWDQEAALSETTNTNQSRPLDLSGSTALGAEKPEPGRMNFFGMPAETLPKSQENQTASTDQAPKNFVVEDEGELELQQTVSPRGSTDEAPAPPLTARRRSDDDAPPPMTARHPPADIEAQSEEDAAEAAAAAVDMYDQLQRRQLPAEASTSSGSSETLRGPARMLFQLQRQQQEGEDIPRLPRLPGIEAKSEAVTRSRSAPPMPRDEAMPNPSPNSTETGISSFCSDLQVGLENCQVMSADDPQVVQRHRPRARSQEILRGPVWPPGGSSGSRTPAPVAPPASVFSPPDRPSSEVQEAQIGIQELPKTSEFSAPEAKLDQISALQRRLQRYVKLPSSGRRIFLGTRVLEMLCSTSVVAVLLAAAFPFSGYWETSPQTLEGFDTLPWHRWQVSLPPLYRPSGVLLEEDGRLHLASGTVMRSLKSVQNTWKFGEPSMLPSAAHGLARWNGSLVVLGADGLYRLPGSLLSIAEEQLSGGIQVTPLDLLSMPPNAASVQRHPLPARLGETNAGALMEVPTSEEDPVAAVLLAESTWVQLCRARLSEGSALEFVARLDVGTLVTITGLHVCPAGTCAGEPVLWATSSIAVLAIGLSSGSNLARYHLPDSGLSLRVSSATDPVVLVTGNSSHLLVVTTSEGGSSSIFTVPYPSL